MKGSHKFWLIILIPILIFFNYEGLIFFNFFKVDGKTSPFFPGSLYMLLFIIELVIAVMFFLRVMLVEPGLLFKFNNWLDEKF